MTYQSPRLARNNFHLLRIAFALIVCMYHAFELSHYPELSWIPVYLSPDVAVNSFFIISGFLITMSFERSNSVRGFLKRRFLRIYPAYLLVVLASAVAFSLITREPAAKYFSVAWIKYILANLCLLNFIQPTLPGVFTENVFPTVNGSLWTIKVEAFLYLTVPALSAIAARGSVKATTLVAYICTALLTTLLGVVPLAKESWICHEISRELTSPLSYFLAGAVIQRHLGVFEQFLKPILAAGIVCLALNSFYPVPVLAPIALAAVIIFVALFCYVGNFEKLGDFSYGVYILHFPIAQVLLTRPWVQGHPWAYLASVMVTAIMGAFFLWHLVEKHFISKTMPHRSFKDV